MFELDAFRSLIDLERQSEEWPRAIPLLEQALKLYDLTKQKGKREAIRKRLVAVDPENPIVEEYFDVEEREALKDAAIKICGMTDDQKQELDQACALVKEVRTLLDINAPTAHRHQLQSRGRISFHHSR